jgi:hypothetical protein
VPHTVAIFRPRGCGLDLLRGGNLHAETAENGSFLAFRPPFQVELSTRIPCLVPDDTRGHQFEPHPSRSPTDVRELWFRVYVVFDRSYNTSLSQHKRDGAIIATNLKFLSVGQKRDGQNILSALSSWRGDRPRPGGSVTDATGSEKTRAAMPPSAAAVPAEWIMMVIFQRKDTRCNAAFRCGGAGRMDHDGDF